MNPDSSTRISSADAQAVAERLVAARRSSRPLDDFPGEIPDSLTSAYRIQDCAISLWPDRVAGWKVGRIPPAVEEQFGIDRLAGPIFATTIRHASSGEIVEMPVFDGGFAAVEAEYVAVIAADAPTGKTEWSIEEATQMIADLRIGLEVASSPLPTINDLGPAVVVSDFGNNAGLIVGPSIRDWSTRGLETMTCKTFVNDELVGSGGAFKLTGGFVRSVQFLLELCAVRGRPLKKGNFVATGQTSGIHDVRIGQTGRIDFGDDGELACLAIAAVSSA
jgi:2-keto-4-pentenoate hydratase